MKTRIRELLRMLEEAAKGDKAAGRVVWAESQLELVRLVRKYMLDKRPGFQRGNKTPSPWRTGRKNDDNGPELT